MAEDETSQSEDKKNAETEATDTQPAEGADKPAAGSDEETSSTEGEIDNPDAVDEDEDTTEETKPGLKGKLKKLINPYMLLFIFVLVAGLVLMIVLQTQSSNNATNDLNFEGSELDQDSVNELLANDTNIGTVDETLTIGANAIFNGKILVKDSLDVAGSINVGGPLSLPGITVAGESTFDSIKVENSLTIQGNTTIDQNLSIQENLTVTGDASIGGTLTAAKINADTLVFTGNLKIPRHLESSGGIPGVVRGSALGAGGTVSASGNDVGGTITVNTGGSPPAGVLATINFVNTYASTPAVIISPVGVATGGLEFYTTRSASGFSVGTRNAPNSGTTYIFDYFVVQ